MLEPALTFRAQELSSILLDSCTAHTAATSLCPLGMQWCDLTDLFYDYFIDKTTIVVDLTFPLNIAFSFFKCCWSLPYKGEYFLAMTQYVWHQIPFLT